MKPKLPPGILVKELSPCILVSADRLWAELNHGVRSLVPLKADWIPLTKKRLRSVMRRMGCRD